MNKSLHLSHTRRDVKSALEMAVVALAPAGLLTRLAAAAGLLESLAELPSDCAPAIALLPRTLERAERALADWRTWEKANLKKGVA